MKSILVITILLSFFIKSYCQSADSTLPVKIELKLISSYTTYVSKTEIPDYLKRYYTEILGDSVARKSFDIEMSISNTSKDSIFISLMNCSWGWGFLVNNNYMFMRGYNCDRNFPEFVKFKAGEAKVYKLTLDRDISFYCPGDDEIFPITLTTRLGLIVTKAIYKPNKLFIFTHDPFTPIDKSTWRVIWSTPLYLIGE